MKRFVPLKYILGMIVLFFIVPVTVIFLILNDETIAICIFLGALPIVGLPVYYKNQENASIVFTEGQIINYINDGTSNFGWAEEIADIKSVRLVGKEDVQKYYKQYNKQKALLIDFGQGNIKYIHVGLFSKRQIQKIMKLLTPKQ